QNLITNMCWDYVITRFVENRIVSEHKEVAANLHVDTPSMADIYRLLNRITVPVESLISTRAKFSAFYKATASLMSSLLQLRVYSGDEHTLVLVTAVVKSDSVISAYEKFVAGFVLRRQPKDIPVAACAVNE
ncbi:hypothetical protein PFISCL1PPCAC_4031, partial [Pristionchus fissidentatus]